MTFFTCKKRIYSLNCASTNDFSIEVRAYLSCCPWTRPWRPRVRKPPLKSAEIKRHALSFLTIGVTTADDVQNLPPPRRTRTTRAAGERAPSVKVACVPGSEFPRAEEKGKSKEKKEKRRRRSPWACHVTAVSDRVRSPLLVIGKPACIILSLTISGPIE